jgi:hypothetical protein
MGSIQHHLPGVLNLTPVILKTYLLFTGRIEERQKIEYREELLAIFRRWDFRQAR